MTNVLLAVIREHQHKRTSKNLSIQYIFNRMILKNQTIEGNYSGNDKNKAYAQTESSSAPSFLSMCFSALQLCIS